MEPLDDQIYEPIIGDVPEPPKEHVITGFPSPADDYVGLKLDLNELFHLNDPGTFLWWAKGRSTTDSEIMDEDLLCVRRGIAPRDGSIVIVKHDGEFVLKRFSKNESTIAFSAINDEHTVVEASSEADIQVWGVVTRLVRELKH